TDVREINASFICHLQKEQERKLLDIFSVPDAVMAERMAEAPKFLINVAHAAIASLNLPISCGSCPGKTFMARAQPPARSKIGKISKSSFSIDSFSIKCPRMRSSHWRCSAVKVCPSVT